MGTKTKSDSKQKQKKKTGRPKPMVSKAGLTKNKYSCGGRIKNS